MSKIIAVVNQKGGVAKTTTSVNLASYLAGMGHKILLVDIDPQGNATSGLGTDRSMLNHCIYDVLINGVPVEAVVLPAGKENLEILPATISLAGAEVELVSAISRETKLKRALKPVKEKYSFIFIDCPPSLGLLTLNALTAADTILIPIQCEYYALEGLGQLIQTHDLVRNHLNPELDIEGVLLTMYDARTKLSGAVEEEVRTFFGDKVYEAVIPRNIRLSEAPSHGQPISEYSPESKGAEFYEKLAVEFLAKQKSV